MHETPDTKRQARGYNRNLPTALSTTFPSNKTWPGSALLSFSLGWKTPFLSKSLRYIYHVYIHDQCGSYKCPIRKFTDG